MCSIPEPARTAAARCLHWRHAAFRVRPTPNGDAMTVTTATSGPAARPELEQTYRKILLRLIPFLMVLWVLAWLDRVNIGFVKLTMLDELKWTEAVYGLGAGIFFLGYFFFEVP